jgi:hypothetical protein
MAKKPTGYRQTVYISMDLKQRMDKVAEEVNWSTIAANAFEQKLSEIAARKERKSMQDVIQRLRGLKVREDKQTYETGKRAGTRWAKPVRRAFLDTSRTRRCFWHFLSHVPTAKRKSRWSGKFLATPGRTENRRGD